MTRTERHRLAQVRLGTQTTALLVVLWTRTQPRSDADFARWLVLAMAIIRDQAARSAAIAGAYYSDMRGTGYTPLLVDTIDEQRVMASLTATGPAAMRRSIGNGAALEEASATAQATSSASGMRHALNAGRATVLANVIRDKEAYAWRRVSSVTACKWCSARSGQVVRAESADFHSHDGCGCSAEPLFRS